MIHQWQKDSTLAKVLRYKSKYLLLVVGYTGVMFQIP